MEEQAEEARTESGSAAAERVQAVSAALLGKEYQYNFTGMLAELCHDKGA